LTACCSAFTILPERSSPEKRGLTFGFKAHPPRFEERHEIFIEERAERAAQEIRPARKTFQDIFQTTRIGKVASAFTVNSNLRRRGFFSNSITCAPLSAALIAAIIPAAPRQHYDTFSHYYPVPVPCRHNLEVTQNGNLRGCGGREQRASLYSKILYRKYRFEFTTGFARFSAAPPCDRR
jgi:hypothetical protein